MPDWTANEDRYMAEARGESIYDPRPREDEARCRDCRDGVNWHCGDCGCCRDAAPREHILHTGLAIIALAAVLDGLICKAQLPMGTQQAPVAECDCRDCETAQILNAAIRRLEAA